MSVSVMGILSPLLSVINAIVPTLVGSKLSNYSSIAQTAVKSAVTSIDGGIDKLQAAFDTFEAGNQVVAASVAEFVTLANSLGIALPKEDAIVTHLKAAIADLSGILVPQTADTTPVAAPIASVATATTSTTSGA